MRAKGTGAHARLVKIILAAVLLFAPAVARAGVVALTPEQVEAAKEAGAARNARDAALGQEPSRDRAVHGEVGVAIGTGGYRALYGTAGVPLGEDGFAILSVADERFGKQRFRRR